MVQTPRGYLDERRHGPIHAVTETKSFRLKIIKALSRKRRIGGQYRRSLTHHPVSLFETRDAGTGFGDYSGKLMAENDRVIHLPTLFARVLMQVTAANSGSLNGEKNVLLAYFGKRQFTEFDRVGILCVIDEANHKSDCA